MPQLDFAIITSQIFWSITIFFASYTILTHFFLPNFIKVLKARKKILLKNNNLLISLKEKFLEKQNIFDSAVDLNLKKIKILVEKEVFLFFKSHPSIDLNLLNKNIVNVLYFNLSSYDTNVLDSINIKLAF